ncbi:MAG: hypothetical protein WCA18_01445 [Candidatus Nanoarchaeia archaeon]
MRYKILLLALIFISLQFVYAAIPQTLGVHGKLTDSSGNALSGNYNIVFNIYNTLSGGTTLYQSAQTITVNSDGTYDAILNNINLTFNQSYFLGIKVGNDAEMNPRINLTTSPYSFYAQNVSVSGIVPDTNFSLGSYNLTANYLFGNGSFLTNVPSIETFWNSNFSNFTSLYGNQYNNYTNFTTLYSGDALNWSNQFNNYTNVNFNQSNYSIVYAYALNSSNTWYGNSTGALNTNNTAINLNITTGYFNVTDQTGNVFIENGTYAFFNQSVGIGTTSPSALLDLQGATTSSIPVINVSSGSSNSATYAAQILQASGNRAGLLINKTTAGNGNGLVIDAISNTGSLLSISNNGSNYLTVLGSTGNVGIGTTSPLYQLDINNASSGNNDYATLFLESLNAGTQHYGYILQGGLTQGIGASLAFIANNNGVLTNVMEMNATGNVGIGTTNPNRLLQVADTTSRSPGGIGSLAVGNGTSNLDIGFNLASKFAWIQSGIDGVSFNSLALNPEGSNVGIGTTSPSQALSVSGNATINGVMNLSSMGVYAPACGAAWNGSIIFNNSGYYACGVAGTWTKFG